MLTLDKIVDFRVNTTRAPFVRTTDNIAVVADHIDERHSGEIHGRRTRPQAPGGYSRSSV